MKVQPKRLVADVAWASRRRIAVIKSNTPSIEIYPTFMPPSCGTTRFIFIDRHHGGPKTRLMIVPSSQRDSTKFLESVEHPSAPITLPVHASVISPSGQSVQEHASDPFEIREEELTKIHVAGALAALLMLLLAQLLSTSH